jgi:hypothetical protein
MEHVSSNYTGSVPVLNSGRPNSSNSIIDRIRQITQSVLATMDQLYEKFRLPATVALVIGLSIAVPLSEAYFAAACILGVSSILGLGVDLYLGSRHRAYLCNKIISKDKDLQMQLRSIKQQMEIAKLVEQTRQSPSREEFIENKKNLAASLKNFQKTIYDAYVQYKSSLSALELSCNHEDRFRDCFHGILIGLEPSFFYNDPSSLCMEIINNIETSFDFAEKTISCEIALFENEVKKRS